MNKYLNIFGCAKNYKLISKYIRTGKMAWIWIWLILEGHFIWIFEYWNIYAHHCSMADRDILNVSTITTSGCVKFSLAGVNFFSKHTVFCRILFCGLIVILFLCKKNQRNGETIFFLVLIFYLQGIFWVFI